MIELIVPMTSTMDDNLQSYISEDGLTALTHWTTNLESLPGVKSAEWISKSTIGQSYTRIIFETEEEKTFFILRWS
jgi:hypothetical protein